MSLDNKASDLYAVTSLIDIHASKYLPTLIPHSTYFYSTDSNPSSSTYLYGLRRLRGSVEHDNRMLKLMSGTSEPIIPLGIHYQQPQVQQLRQIPHHQILFNDSIILTTNTGLDDIEAISVIVGVAFFVTCFISALFYSRYRRQQARQAMEREEFLESPRDDINIKLPTQPERSGLRAFVSSLLTPLSLLPPYRHSTQRQRRRSTNTPANGGDCIGVLHVRREEHEVSLSVWQRHVVRLQEGWMELFNLEDDSSETVDLKGYSFCRESDRLSLISIGDPPGNDILLDLRDEGVSCTMFQGILIRSNYPTLDDWIHFLGVNVDIANKHDRHRSSGGTIGTVRYGRLTSGTRSSKGSNSTLSSPRYRAESGRPWGLSSSLLSPGSYGGNSPHHGEISNGRYKCNSNCSDNVDTTVTRRLDGSFEEPVDSNGRRIVPRTHLKIPPPLLISPRPISPSLTIPPPPNVILDNRKDSQPNLSHNIFISKNDFDDNRKAENSRTLQPIPAVDLVDDNYLQSQVKEPSNCSDSDNISSLYLSVESNSGVSVSDTSLNQTNSVGNIQINSTQIGNTNNAKCAMKILSPEKLTGIGQSSSRLQRLMSAQDVPSSSPTTLPDTENPMPRRSSTETSEQHTRPQLSQSNTLTNHVSIPSALFTTPELSGRDKCGNQYKSTFTRIRGSTISLENGTQSISPTSHTTVKRSESAKTLSWRSHPLSASSTPFDSHQQHARTISPTSRTRPGSFRSILNRLTINTHLQSDAYPQTNHSEFQYPPPPLNVSPNNPSVYPANLATINILPQSCSTSPSGLFSHPEEPEDINSPMPSECNPNLSILTEITSTSTGTVNSSYANASHCSHGVKANFWTGLNEHASGANSRLRTWSFSSSPALLNSTATSTNNSSTPQNGVTVSDPITVSTVTSVQKEPLTGRFTLTWKPPNYNPSEKSILGLLEARRGANRPSFTSVGGSAPPLKSNSPPASRRKTPA